MNLFELCFCRCEGMKACPSGPEVESERREDVALMEEPLWSRHQRLKDGASTYPDHLWAGVVRGPVREERGIVTR